jgi:protein-disulfide isomerase
MAQRLTIWAAAAFWLAAILAHGPALAQSASPGAVEMSLGKANATVTITEFASLTCSHCANFHENTLPLLKRDYIDTGKVRLVYRDFPFDEVALRAAMLARCIGPERYFGFLEVLFKQQATWSRAPVPLDALAQLARVAGIGDTAFRACLADRALEEYVLKGRLEGQSLHDVNSTPTFIIGGAKYAGFKTIDEMKAIIDPILAGGTAPAAAPVAAQAPQAAPAPSMTSGLTGTWLAVGGVVLVTGIAIFLILRRRGGVS